VAPIVAGFGVHVGWSIESLDWECSGKPGCATELRDRVLRRLDAGRRGTILLHSTVPETAEVLPSIIAEIRKRGLRFTTSEALVREKYGKSSAQLRADWLAK
jgi:peptidoglycan/xylan/chitin deacetylase (PgdA/CDA1 family)